MGSPNREDFLANLKEGGKHAGVVGVYRRNVSAKRMGVFDAPIVSALAAAGVKWITHNGAGYDKIDVHSCMAVGNAPTRSPTRAHLTTHAQG